MADLAAVAWNPDPSWNWPQAEKSAPGAPQPIFPGGPAAEDELELSPEAKKYQEKLEGKTDSPEGAPGEEKLDEASQREVEKLKQIEQHVRMHEAAHMAAGGGMTGAPHYEYTQGPDGKRYIVGGEVSIRMSTGGDPREVIANMQQAQRAAMAPSDPSPQDMAVAAQAAQMEAQARAELADDQSGNGNQKQTGVQSEETSTPSRSGSLLNIAV